MTQCPGSCCLVSASSQLGTAGGPSFLSLETINHQHCDPQHNFTVKDPDSNLLSNYISGKPSKYNPTFNQLVGRTASRQDSGLKATKKHWSINILKFSFVECWCWWDVPWLLNSGPGIRCYLSSLNTRIVKIENWEISRPSLPSQHQHQHPHQINIVIWFLLIVLTNRKWAGE